MWNPNNWNPVYVIVGTLSFFALVGALAALAALDFMYRIKCELCRRPFAIFALGSLEACYSCVRRSSRRSRPRRKSIVPIGRAWRR